MRVIERLEERHGAVEASRTNHGDLTFEIDECLEHRLSAPERLPRRERVGVRTNGHLSLAVVPERGGLQYRRPPNPRESHSQIELGADLGVWRHRQSSSGKKALLPDPVLRNC